MKMVDETKTDAISNDVTLVACPNCEGTGLIDLLPLVSDKNPRRIKHRCPCCRGIGKMQVIDVANEKPA